MNKLHGAERRQSQKLLKNLKYHQRKWGYCDAREARIKDLEKELKLKK